MSNKKNRFSAKGYYIALVLCAAAIGVSGYLYYRNTAKETADVPAAVTQQGLPEAGATRPSAPKETTEPTETVTLPKEPMKTAAPVEGEAVAEYAMDCLSYNQTTRDWRVHNGIDIAADAGTTVCAAAAGTVYTVFQDDTMGTTVVIRHEGGYVTQYASLAEDVSVKTGDTVQMGDAIGKVANTALLESAQGDHLHFSVMLNDEHVDPLAFLEME